MDALHRHAFDPLSGPDLGPDFGLPAGPEDAVAESSSERATQTRGAAVSAAVRAEMLRLLVEMGRLHDEAARLRRRVAELEALADTDPLADVLNRRAFLREFDRMIAHAARYGGAVSLIYLDLDAFKSVNDRFGHAAGDAVIRHVAQILRRRTRASDIVGRMGGDEFTVALSHADHAAALARAFDLCRAIAADPADFEGRAVTVTCTCGAEAVRPGEMAQHVVARADEAMYARKVKLAAS